MSFAFIASPQEAGQSELRIWQRRYESAFAAYQAEREKMDWREKRYNGTNEIKGPDGMVLKKRASHVQNIVLENVETLIDVNIPQPKVTAQRAQDEWKAKRIEDMIRNTLNALPFEMLNDQQERTTPIQGGDYMLVDWDQTRRTHTTTGGLCVKNLHPKMVIPQSGVYTALEDMDFFFTMTPQTKGYVFRRYGVCLWDENESEPEAKDPRGGAQTDDMVTLMTAYYKNLDGGRGRYVWVNEVELESLPDYQARRLKICGGCGGSAPGTAKVCPHCGSKKLKAETRDAFELEADLTRSDGTVIPMYEPVRDEFGLPVLGSYGGVLAIELGAPEPPGMENLANPYLGTADYAQSGAALQQRRTRIPYFKPDVYPLILRKNVSKYGQLLGGSDVDAIESEQNTANMIATKLKKKILGGGSVLAKPKDMKFTVTDEDYVVLDVAKPEDLSKLGVYNLQVDISKDMTLKGEVYEEARNILGVTDSLQGRRDPTATSAVAKQYSAQQAAGRLQSRRKNKEAAYADLFRIIFLFELAYADEQRPIVGTDGFGGTKYSDFCKWDYLEQDDAGEWYWNTDFLFSCDANTPLSEDRSAIWQESWTQYQAGAFGDPGEVSTRILFWGLMADNHYPGAERVKQQMEEQKKQMSQAQKAPALPAGEGGMPV